MSSRLPWASIVIPTFNRLDDLRRVIDAVQNQAAPEGAEIEIVVVDDGSSDGTWEWLQSRSRDRRLNCRRQANSGPAAARNAGAAAARGELVLFLGDDTVPREDWLIAHLEEHRLFGARHELAVVGYTTFPPESETPFQRFINEYGAQFGYQLIDRPRAVPFNFFYTSNVSLRRAFLLANGGFREDFPAAAWEDIEFAYRAVAAGMSVHYQPRARCIHHHHVRPRTFYRRQRTSGRSAAIFAAIHPDLEEFLGVGRLPASRRTRRVVDAVLTELAEVAEIFRLPLPVGLYQRMLDSAYLAGLEEGLQG